MEGRTGSTTVAAFSFLFAKKNISCFRKKEFALVIFLYYNSGEMNTLDTVKKTRATAARIMIKARMGTATTCHPAIGALEDRLAEIEKEALEIMDLIHTLDPGFFRPNPPKEVAFKEV